MNDKLFVLVIKYLEEKIVLKDKKTKESQVQ